MTIEAETLVQLAAVLKKSGINRIADINFLRAPYRRDHKWTCVISRKTLTAKRNTLRA